MLAFTRWTVIAFSVVLALTGGLALAEPGAGGATSTAPPYAWFHLVSAVVGLAFALVGKGRGAAAFALGFGVVDLYQWVASWAGWFPEALFQWTATDDVLHLGLGVALIAVGLSTLLLRRRA